jgi:hypothetical protein
MLLKKLTFEQALDLEEEGLLTIYDYLGSYEDTEYHPKARTWAKNYIEFLFKFRHLRPSQVNPVLNCDYQITVELPTTENGTRIWKLLYGKTTSDLEKLNQYYSKGSYVYILVNEVYNFVKIGKASNPQRRVKEINGAGVVSEWKLLYALPVENDYVVENFVHQYLAKYRKDSDQGSTREYFEVDPEYAIKVIEDLAEDFRRGDPVYY